MQNVRAFIRKIEADPVLEQKASGLLDGNLDGLLKLAAEVGTPFTPADYGKFVETKGAGELDEAELNLVAGGMMADRYTPSTKFLCRTKGTYCWGF